MQSQSKTNQYRLNKKGISVQNIQSTDITPTKRISPQQKNYFIESNQTDEYYLKTLRQSTRIKQLLQENLKLLQESSEKDLEIGILYRDYNQNDDLRSQRVQTLNNLQPISNNKFFYNNRKPQQINEKIQKEDKLLFTFYSPEQKSTSQVFKLPKVFKSIPNQKKFFI